MRVPACLLAVALACRAATAGAADPTIRIDDFEKPGEPAWRAADTNRPVAIVQDPDRRSRVLMAWLRYDGRPLFLTRSLAEPIPLHRLRALSFWYKLTTRKLSAERALVCRLRTSPTSFVDYPVATRDSIKPGRWTRAAIDLARPKRLVNVYRSYFDTVKHLTLRLDGEQGTAVRFELLVDDVVAELKEPLARDYEPHITDRPRPDGPRSALIIKNSAACYYHLERVVRSLPLPTAARVLKFRGLHFPVFGFPRTRAELMGVSLVALVDVDPYVLSMEQAQWLADLVASGGGLLVCGGPNTLGQAKDLKAPLANLLPVEVEPGSALVAVGRAPRAVGQHYITSGIPPRLGSIARAYRLKARAGATTVLEAPWAGEAGGQDATLPVLVVGGFHMGRVAVLNAHPDVADSLEGDFFTSDFCDDLLRQTLRWLLYEEPRITIAELEPPPRDVPAGKPVGADLAVELGRATKATVTYRCTRDGEETARGETTLTADDPARARFAVAAEAPGNRTTRYELTFEVRDWKGSVQATRTCPLIAHAPLDAEIRFRYGKLAVAPGRQLRFRVLAREWTGDGFVAPQGELSARARIVDFAGELLDELLPMGMVRGEGGWPHAEFVLDLPDASSGAYGLDAELLRAGQVVGGCTRRFHVVDRLERAGLYPIASIIGGGGGHQADAELMRERVDDLVAHGFNVGAVGGVTAFREWGPQMHREAIRNATEACAQARGMALLYEYQRYTNLRRDRPPAPCVHAPGYREALRRHVAPYLAVGAAVPRLLSIKVIDEPHAGPATMDYCEHCRRAWRERFGTELRKPDAIAPDDRAARRQHIEFIRDTVAKGYRIGHELKAEAAAPWDLLLTFCAPAFGRSSDLLRSQEDLLWWAATADRVDFDVYPYFYPVSDRIVFLQAHYSMALMRDTARHLGKPWGFYVELDDRNYPLQINPREASSECAWTAVAQGARYLNTFIHRTFGTGNQARPARWAHLGGTLKQIRAAGPLLNATTTPPARLALLFPYTHWQLARERWEPYHAHQLLLRAFGECDVVHEQVARREGRFHCQALALLQTDTLPDEVAKLIVRFVERGGLLLCDRIPRFNEDGKPCKLPPDLFPTPPVTTKTTGKGKTLLLPSELDAAFAEAVAADDAEPRRELRERVRALLLGRGLRPRALADQPDFEVGYREAKDTIVLTVVNHAARAAESAVTLFGPPFTVGSLTDAAGRAVALEKVEGGLRFPVRLPARSGVLLFGRPALAAKFQLVVLTPTVRRGGRLRYRVIAQTADGVLCEGHYVTELRATDPAGVSRPRYAPLGVTSEGVREVAVPVAVNAPGGTWRITLRDPLAGAERAGSFEVR